MQNDFKKQYSLEQRREEAVRIKNKYSDRIPVIVEKAIESKIQDLDKRKFLVPGELTLGQFVYVIRKRIKLNPNESIFLFVNDVLPSGTTMMSQLYENYKDEDEFLYIKYSGENTFGV
jgi:GABA(A) receptor-associated protein